MGKAAGGVNKTKAKAILSTIEASNATIKSTLTTIEEDIKKLENGDGTTPYWNGAKAYTWVTNALANLDHNKVLLDHLDNIEDYVDIVIKGAKSL